MIDNSLPSTIETKADYRRCIDTDRRRRWAATLADGVREICAELLTWSPELSDDDRAQLTQAANAAELAAACLNGDGPGEPVKIGF